MVFGYLVQRRGGAGSGMRVGDGGEVELRLAGTPDWQQVTTLDARELEALRDAVRASGVLGLPERTERPASLRDGDDCELWSDVDGHSLHAVVEGWADANPAAEGSRRLVMELSRLVAGAQARQ